MCFLRLLILLVIVSLQHLMAKAESQLFIFPLISNLQSHPGLVTVCDADFLTKTNSTSGGFMNQRDVFFLDRPDRRVGSWCVLHGSRCPAVTWERADSHCWSQQGADGQVAHLGSACWQKQSSVGVFASHCNSYTNAANYIQEEFRWNQHLPGLSPDEVSPAVQIKWTQKSRQRCFGFILVSQDIYLPVFFFTLEDNRLNISLLLSYVFSICGLWSIPWKSLTRWIPSLLQVIHGSPENLTL